MEAKGAGQWPQICDRTARPLQTDRCVVPRSSRRSLTCEEGLDVLRTLLPRSRLRDHRSVLRLRADFNGLFGEILCLSHEETCAAGSSMTSGGGRTDRLSDGPVRLGRHGVRAPLGRPALGRQLKPDEDRSSDLSRRPAVPHVGGARGPREARRHHRTRPGEGAGGSLRLDGRRALFLESFAKPIDEEDGVAPSHRRPIGDRTTLSTEELALALALAPTLPPPHAPTPGSAPRKAHAQEKRAA